MGAAPMSWPDSNKTVTIHSPTIIIIVIGPLPFHPFFKLLRKFYDFQYMHGVPHLKPTFFLPVALIQGQSHRVQHSLNPYLQPPLHIQLMAECVKS